MAVEKMQMLNIVAPLEALHSVLEDIVLAGSIHVKNYADNRSQDSLTMQVLGKYLDSSPNIAEVVKYKYNKINFKDLYEKIHCVEKTLDIKLRLIEDIERNYDFNKVILRIDQIILATKPLKQTYDEAVEEISQKEEFLQSVEYLSNMEVNLSELNQMKHFIYHIGTLTKDKRIKLRDNYENIPAIVLHIGSTDGDESYLVFSETKDEEETHKILKSLNFKEINLPSDIRGSITETIKEVKSRIETIKKNAIDVKDIVEDISKDYINELSKLYSEIRLEEKIEETKENVAISKNFFCFSGWVPTSDIDRVKSIVENEDNNIIVLTENAEEFINETIPPTKLKNHKLLRPFELLVDMYGTPNYNEVDPTAFLGITYLILFGAMFGDVGQGIVFVILGMILKTKSRTLLTYGEILIRIGLSSAFFGVMYGSVFGNEHIIPAMLVHPMDNINYVLGAAIIFGVLLLFVSFGLSIYNAIHAKTFEDAIFGRNGIAGLLFYIALLIIGVQWFLNMTIISNGILLIVVLLSLVLMLFKTPLFAMVSNKKAIYHEGKGTYYIEGGFDLIETVLSLLSNTVSFIRVGAFALNHVGLFMAFTTMAEIAGNKVIGLFILLLGNLIIICLEGLIVLIQGLRLEYYEMFSKYFKGDGKKYIPIKLTDKLED